MNSHSKLKISLGHAPRPQGPWTHLQIDFIGPLLPSGGFTYILMTVNLFSRWVEAFPLLYCTADATARIMLNEVFPRWGLALNLDSDQGDALHRKGDEKVNGGKTTFPHCFQTTVQWVGRTYQPHTKNYFEEKTVGVREGVACCYTNDSFQYVSQSKQNSDQSF